MDTLSDWIVAALVQRLSSLTVTSIRIDSSDLLQGANKNIYVRTDETKKHPNKEKKKPYIFDREQKRHSEEQLEYSYWYDLEIQHIKAIYENELYGLTKVGRVLTGLPSPGLDSLVSFMSFGTSWN